jgi:hypothetical protein
MDFAILIGRGALRITLAATARATLGSRLYSFDDVFKDFRNVLLFWNKIQIIIDLLLHIGGEICAF